MTTPRNDERRQRIIRPHSINREEADRFARVLQRELDALTQCIPLHKKRPTEFLRQFLTAAHNIEQLASVSTAQYAEEWYRIGGGKEVKDILGVSPTTLWRRSKRQGEDSTSSRASRVISEVEKSREAEDRIAEKEERERAKEMPTEVPVKPTPLPKTDNPYSEEDYEAV